LGAVETEERGRLDGELAKLRVQLASLDNVPRAKPSKGAGLKHYEGRNSLKNLERVAVIPGLSVSEAGGFGRRHDDRLAQRFRSSHTGNLVTRRTSASP